MVLFTETSRENFGEKYRIRLCPVCRLPRLNEEKIEDQYGILAWDLSTIES